MADLSCLVTREGLPQSCSKGNPLRVMAGGYTVKAGTTFTETEAAAIANYTSKVITKDLLPFHDVHEVEDVSIEKKVQESSLGKKKTTHKGFRGYRLMFDYNLDVYKALDGWMDKDIELIPYDAVGNVIFMSAGGDNLKGFSLSYFDVEKVPVVTADNSMLIAVEVQEADPEEFLLTRHFNPKKATAIADRWNPSDVKTITKITLTPGSVVSDVFSVTVQLISSTEMKDGSDLSQYVTGGLAANFIVKDGSGNTVTPDTVTETSTGIYEIDCTGTGYTGGTVQWSAQASDTRLFESDAETVS